MLTINSNISLKSYNTFGIDAFARYLVTINEVTDLQTLLQLTEFANVPKLILGGGSNILLTRNFDGLVIKMNIQGIELVREDDSHYWVRAGAGVNWHEFVMYCVEHNYAGIENLSLIPGTIGAAPMQNIGAYGVEIEQVFDSLSAIHSHSGELHTFTHSQCQFGYRESVFKHALKGQYIITDVTFRLDKHPVFHTNYGAIQETLTSTGVTQDSQSIKAISNAVISIRRSKLPDPAVIGNAGSFFKNPEIPRAQYEQLRINFPSIPGYPTGENTIKVPAGWLIEQSGWKGKRIGETGVHSKQALVLVNYGQANGHEILDLAYAVQASVSDKFGIGLTMEVNIV